MPRSEVFPLTSLFVDLGSESTLCSSSIEDKDHSTALSKEILQLPIARLHFSNCLLGGPEGLWFFSHGLLLSQEIFKQATAQAQGSSHLVHGKHVAVLSFSGIQQLFQRDLNHFGRPRQANHFRSEVQDKPSQHGETLSLQKISQAWWQVSVIPAIQEAGQENSLNPGGGGCDTAN
ncbi:hypothetical protein AAY473_012026 [Plecturocebus cupreus]